jgi:hypothetical protein
VITLVDIRRLATAFPEVEEFTHLRLRVPELQGHGQPFAEMEKEERPRCFPSAKGMRPRSLPKTPPPTSRVWRPGATKSFVGLRIDLAKVSEKRVQELVEPAWRNEALSGVAAANDAQ